MLVILMLVAQVFNRNFENVFLCVLTLFLFTLPSFLERTIRVEIPDTKGNTVMKIQARRQGEEILLHVEGGNGSFQVRNLGSQKIKVED